MNPILPEELTALIDGELPPQRAEEVRQAIAANTTLQREYNQLTALDAKLKACAAAASFAPQVSLHGQMIWQRAAITGLIAALVAFRLLVKTAPLPLAVGLEVTALCLVAAWAVRRLLRWSHDDLHELFHRAAIQAASC